MTPNIPLLLNPARPLKLTRVAFTPWLNFVFSSVDLKTRVDPLGLASSHKPFPSGSKGQRWGSQNWRQKRDLCNIAGSQLEEAHSARTVVASRSSEWALTHSQPGSGDLSHKVRRAWILPIRRLSLELDFSPESGGELSPAIPWCHFCDTLSRRLS